MRTQTPEGKQWCWGNLGDRGEVPKRQEGEGWSEGKQEGFPARAAESDNHRAPLPSAGAAQPQHLRAAWRTRLGGQKRDRDSVWIYASFKLEAKQQSWGLKTKGDNLSEDGSPSLPGLNSHQGKHKMGHLGFGCFFCSCLLSRYWAPGRLESEDCFMMLHLFSFSKGPLLKQILHHRKQAKFLQEHTKCMWNFSHF